MTVEWKDAGYSCHRAGLGHGLEMGVSYSSQGAKSPDEPRWIVSVFGSPLEERSASLEGGKTRAERVARKWLMEALAVLDQPATEDGGSP